CQEVYTHPFTF
nr:immunoglobulin light chain junction region [Macaca mulatta]MOX50407.1 immunoglobulin light chain junction region [Macaca mulatta]MOX51060.1 immunoglobulin light chain junction region [Macaca mulatta]